MDINKLKSLCFSEGKFEESLIYLERFVNDPKGVFEEHSLVRIQYSPEHGIENFPILNTWMDKNEVTFLCSNPSDHLLSSVTKEDKVLFCSHPEINNYINSYENEIIVAPTASTRTLLTINQPYNYFIKTDLDKLHFKFIRRLKGGSVQHSLLINAELNRFVDSYNPQYFSFLPESIGVIHGDKSTGSGVIYRESIAYSQTNLKRCYLPYFSLYSRDLLKPKDLPIQLQLLELYNTRDKLDLFLNLMIRPLLASWIEVLSKTGLLLELHGQNTLITLNENNRLGKIICRDFQGTYSDPLFRNDLGLTQFEKHVIGDEDGITRQEQYSHVYDDMIGNLLFKRMVRTFVEFYSKWNFEFVCNGIASLFNELTRKELFNLFPSTVYKFPKGPLQDNHVRFIDSGERPLFR